MENNEVNELIDAFIGYREMLTPIQANLHEFLETYSALKSDVDKLNSAFSGDVQAKLSEIYKVLESQAAKSEELTRKVDQFLNSSNKYTEEVGKLINMFESINSRISSVNEIEAKAEEQIGKLDTIIEEKKRSYNLKDLEKSLDNYNNNLQQVSDFINKDVAENIMTNTKSIQSIKDGNDNIVKALADEKKSIEGLIENYKTSNELLKKVVEKEDVNEEYIFDLLDKWAESRKVKTKK